MKKLRDVGVGGRLLVIALSGLIGSICLTVIGLEEIHSNLMKDRKAVIQGEVSTAVSLLSYYHSLEKSGKLTTAEAQSEASKAIASLRYQGESYFSILNFDGVTVMHPFAKKLIGKSQMQITDKTGKFFAKEIVEKSRQNGDAFVSFYWSKPGHDQAVKKLSYYQAFAPWQWIVGTGVYIDDISQEYEHNLLYTVSLLAVVLCVVSGVAFMMRRSIIIPLRGVTRNMLRLADGEHDIDVLTTDAKTEIGDLARALVHFHSRTVEMEDMRHEQEKAKQLTAQHRQEAALQLADKFEASVMSVVADVSSSASDVRQSAEYLTSLSNKMSERSTMVVAATEQASSNVQTVATAAEELSASISEIGRQVTQATSVSGTAANAVHASNEKIQGLATTVAKIGEVVDLITDIADQTNLLALNATIEAARAGDAGKGFAVVASEVKNLANQTGRATGDISNQIGAVQTATEEAVMVIEQIGTVIGEINTATSTIAAAVEQQGAATHEISRNVQEAAVGTQDVASNITEMSGAVGETDTAARSVLDASSSLQKDADALRREVEQFLDHIRRDVNEDVTEREAA